MGDYGRRSKIRLHKGNKWSTKEIVDFIMEIMKIIWITSMKYEIFYEKHFRGFLIQPGWFWIVLEVS